MTKNADFGPILAIFGPKVLIFMGVSKSFGTNITGKPPGQFVRIVRVGANGPKIPIFD